MTVKEMISFLQQFNSDTQVMVRSDNYNDMGINDNITEDSFEIPGDGSIVIRCWRLFVYFKFSKFILFSNIC